MSQRGYGISRDVPTTDVRIAIERGVELAEAYSRSGYVTRSTPARDSRLDSAPAELRARKAAKIPGGFRGGFLMRIFRREAK